MKKILPLLFCCGLIACHTADRSLLSNYLNTSNLLAQSFTINPKADTILMSAGGVRITIAKGTFSSDQPIAIEWKEALDFRSMLKAGLTTQTGKNILRSGGMFYFNTKENLAIQKPIGINVPTETIASGMQLYKGDSSEGKLDWKEPKPIENVRTFGENALGKSLFINNCASCHRMDKDIDGGADLLGVTGRRSKQWLYAVTRNAIGMASIDPIICCQKNKFGVVMPAFPELSLSDIDAIYDYIDYETEKLGREGSGGGCDNCAVINPAYDSLLAIYNQQYRSGWLSRDSIETKKADTLLTKKIIDVSEGKAYYQVTIQSDGWYNIDALFKDWTSAIPSNLIIYPQGERNEEIEYYLAIPAMKILANGTVQNKGETVVFNEASGQIPLPQQRGAFIIAVGGEEDKYFFAKKDFITAVNQTINLPIQKITPYQFNAQMKELTYYGLNAQVENVRNISAFIDKVDSTMIGDEYKSPLTRIEIQLQKLAAQKRKDCGCDQLPLQSARADKTVYDYESGKSVDAMSDTAYNDEPKK